MELLETIQAGLGQRPQAESQLRENFLTGRRRGMNVNDSKDFDIITVPHHGSAYDSGHEVLPFEQVRKRIEEAIRDAMAQNLSRAEAFAGCHPRPYIMESHRGVVSEVVGNQVEITYETPAGPLKQIYSREQFSGGVVPNEGDDVEAKVTVTVVDREPNVFEEEFESDIPSFEGRGIKGRARI